MSTMETGKLDRELQEVLLKRKRLGVADLKCHVEVTAVTSPHDFKRALVNVLRREETLLGDECFSLSEIRTLEEIFE